MLTACVLEGVKNQEETFSLNITLRICLIDIFILIIGFSRLVFRIAKNENPFNPFNPMIVSRLVLVFDDDVHILITSQHPYHR